MNLDSKQDTQIVRFYRCKLCLGFTHCLNELVTHWTIDHGIDVVGEPNITLKSNANPLNKDSISAIPIIKTEKSETDFFEEDINWSDLPSFPFKEGKEDSSDLNQHFTHLNLSKSIWKKPIKALKITNRQLKKYPKRISKRKMNINLNTVNVNNANVTNNATNNSTDVNGLSYHHLGTWTPDLFLPLPTEILEPQGEDSSFACPICNIQFQTRSQLMGHTRKHMKDKLFQCKLCEQNFPSNKELKSHLGDKTENQVDEFSIKCGICSRAFPTQACLTHHLNCHKQAGSAPVIIDNPSAERRYSCSLCSKTFKNSQHVQRHLRIHTGEKPFSCDLCGQSFSLNHNLQRHMRTHTGEKPHKCPVCAKEFAEGHNLKRHMISAHDGPTPYICTICNRKFAENSILRKHQSRAHKQQQQQQNTSQQ